MIVNNMAESIGFCTEVMGFEIDSWYSPQPAILIKLMKSNGDAMVELIKERTHETGFYSVGIDVEDLNATEAKFETKGAKITMEPVSTLVGSLVFLEDPNGVRLV